MQRSRMQTQTGMFLTTLPNANQANAWLNARDKRTHPLSCHGSSLRSPPLKHSCVGGLAELIVGRRLSIGNTVRVPTGNDRAFDPSLWKVPSLTASESRGPHGPLTLGFARRALTGGYPGWDLSVEDTKSFESAPSTRSRLAPSCGCCADQS